MEDADRSANLRISALQVQRRFLKEFLLYLKVLEVSKRTVEHRAELNWSKTCQIEEGRCLVSSLPTSLFHFTTLSTQQIKYYRSPDLQGSTFHSKHFESYGLKQSTANTQSSTF